MFPRQALTIRRPKYGKRDVSNGLIFTSSLHDSVGAANVNRRGMVFADDSHVELPDKLQPPADATIRTSGSTLEERLHEIIVFELHENGSSEYRTMTLRALYNYVVSTIATSCREANQARFKMHMLEEQNRNAFDNFDEKSLNDSNDDHMKGRQSHDSKLVDMSANSPFSANSPSRLQSLSSNIVSTLRIPSPPLLSEFCAMSRTSEELNQDLNTLYASSFRHNGEVSTPGASSINANTVTHPRDHLGGYLHPRDMRRLVTPFSSSNEPQLMVRRHVMLLNFDPLRAIVLRDRLLVLVPDGADSILIELEKRVRGGLLEMVNDVFGWMTEHETNSQLRRRKKCSEANSKLKPNIDEQEIDRSQTDVSVRGASSINCIGVMKMDKTHSWPMSTDTNYQSVEETNEPDNLCENEWKEIPNGNWSHMPYEFLSVDAVLQTVVSMLGIEARIVKERTLTAVHEMRGESHSSFSSKMSGLPGEHTQSRLRLHKDEIKKLEGRVQGFVRAMNEILDDDEDMSLMNLSRLLTHPERFLQPVPQDILHEESDEPELILEAHLQQALSISNDLDLVKAQIVTTQEQISMTLDEIRNKLLYINTLLSLSTLCMTAGAYIGALFGMNLSNPFIEDPNTTYFLRVTWGTSIGIVISWTILFFLFHHQTTHSTDWKKTYNSHDLW